MGPFAIQKFCLQCLLKINQALHYQKMAGHDVGCYDMGGARNGTSSVDLNLLIWVNDVLRARHAISRVARDGTSALG